MDMLCQFAGAVQLVGGREEQQYKGCQPTGIKPPCGLRRQSVARFSQPCRYVEIAPFQTEHQHLRTYLDSICVDYS